MNTDSYAEWLPWPTDDTPSWLTLRNSIFSLRIGLIKHERGTWDIALVITRPGAAPTRILYEGYRHPDIAFYKAKQIVGKLKTINDVDNLLRTMDIGRLFCVKVTFSDDETLVLLVPHISTQKTHVIRDVIDVIVVDKGRFVTGVNILNP